MPRIDLARRRRTALPVAVLCGLAWLVLCAWTASSRAQSFSCDDASGSGDCLPWGLTIISDLPGEITALSADGSAIAGPRSSPIQAWRWRREVGSSLLTIPGATRLFPRNDAQSISANGSIVVGIAEFGASNRRAFLWEPDAGTHLLLPEGPALEALRIQGAGNPPGEWSVIPMEPSISADGSTVVGVGDAVRRVNGVIVNRVPRWAFKWTAGAGTSDVPQNPFSFPVFVHTGAGDGFSQIAQTTSGPGLIQHSVRNVNGVAETINPSLSRPSAVSHDGSTIAGTLGTSPFNAYRWSASNGLATIVIPRFVPRAISDDGVRIVGVRADFPSVNQSTPWFDDIENPTALGRNLVGFLSGSTPQSGFGMSLPAFPSSGAGTPIPFGLVDRAGTTFSVVRSNFVARAIPLDYVAMGDSYSSGEGVPGRSLFGELGLWEANTDIAGTNECHRSRRAYSILARPRKSRHTFRSFRDVPKWSYRSVACSGAKSHNLSSLVPPPPGEPATQWNELHQIDAANLDTDTDLVTLTIGGNDSFFKEVLIACAFAIGPCQDRVSPQSATGQTWSEFLPEHIRSTVRDRVVSALQDIRNTAPNATIVLLGYPQLFERVECSVGGGGLISSNEQGFLRLVTVVLNATLASAAREVGVHYVPTFMRFKGHGVCAGSAAFLKGINLQEPKEFWFHPNDRGQSELTLIVNEFLADASINSGFEFSASGLPKNPDPNP